jgi:DNA processing protein
LWALGPERLDETAQRAAAVVGTRAATAYGDDMAVEVPLARATVQQVARR